MVSLNSDFKFDVEENFQEYKDLQGYPFTKRGTKSKILKNDQLTDILWDYSQSIQLIRQLLMKKKYFLNAEVRLGNNQLTLRKQNDYIYYFWLTVSVCHDVIAVYKNQNASNSRNEVQQERNSQDLKDIQYQGSSPDEVTLLDAAKEIGFIFKNRTTSMIDVEIFGV